jgi:mannose/cellobiose epimerase-like protein (N-acyl-D-glucosamine 2-epimerase family)
MKLGATEDDALWFDRLWRFARSHFVDPVHGGWIPEIDDAGRPAERQFAGKPDIYHALQAELFPLTPGLSGYYTTLQALRA